jgi:hypothetical protein
MIYGYECRQCGQGYESNRRGNVLEVLDYSRGVTGGPVFYTSKTCLCGHHEIKRKYSISATPMMHSHMNASTGSLISDHAQFARELKMKGEMETERTGIPCNYVPIDPDEALAQVVKTGAVGLDSTNQARMNEGKPPIRIKGVL